MTFNSGPILDLPILEFVKVKVLQIVDSYAVGEGELRRPTKGKVGATFLAAAAVEERNNRSVFLSFIFLII